MRFVKTLIPATAMAMATTLATAAERPFVGGYIAESSSNYAHSTGASVHIPGADFDRTIDDSTGWGLRGGVDYDTARYYLTYDYVSDAGGRADIREQKLTASYDLKFPIASNTSLFGGASVGLEYVKQNTSGFRNDSDWGYLAGVQAGLLQQLNPDLELELGVRYAKHTQADVNFRRSSDGAKLAKADLESNNQAYIGLNWKF